MYYVINGIMKLVTCDICDIFNFLEFKWFVAVLIYYLYNNLW